MNVQPLIGRYSIGQKIVFTLGWFGCLVAALWLLADAWHYFNLNIDRSILTTGINIFVIYLLYASFSALRFIHVKIELHKSGVKPTSQETVTAWADIGGIKENNWADVTSIYRKDGTLVYSMFNQMINRKEIIGAIETNID